MQPSHPPQEPPLDPIDTERRRFLHTAAAGAAAILLIGTGEACTPADPEIKAGTLRELEEQGFLSPTFNGYRIFTTQREGQIITFSLKRSHKRCTVKWKEAKQEFQCPCHEGRYDKDGNVLSGPPPAPLTKLKTELRGQEIWVLNEQA